MTTESHDLPNADFRSHLEWEVSRAFRREVSLGTQARARRQRRVRGALIVVACLAIGLGSNLASAQVQGDARKDSLLQAARAEMELARLREQLAQQQYDLAAKKYAAGAIGQGDLAALRAQLDEVVARVTKLNLNIAEIRAAKMPARDDLNAPMIDGRDFVKERIQADLMATQQKLSAKEQALAEIDRQRRLGTATELKLSEARIEADKARQDLMVAAEKLKLRQEFIEKKTPVDKLMNRFDSAQRVVDLEMALRQKDVAALRLEEMRKQRAAGTATELDLMKAEVQLKEREVELTNMKLQLDAKLKAMKQGGGE